jgi:hypothetical protein
MRRVAAAFVMPFLLLAAACSTAPGGGTAGAPAATGSAAASAAPPGSAGPAAAGGPSSAGGASGAADPGSVDGDRTLAGNKQAICEQAARTSASFGETFVADLKLQIDAASQGPAVRAQAQQKIARDVASYSSALSGMAEMAGDAAVKKALIAMSKQVQALKGDVTKINAEKMGELTATLEAACGNR